MNWLEALLLGILQGLTEFLPVSSSGHLTIGQELLNLNTSAADNLLFTVTVHAATVLSTIVILWKEIENLFKGTFFSLKWNPEKEYVSKILLSIIPVMIVGLFFKDQVEAIFGSGLLIVGCCLLLTATLLTFAYYAKPRKKENISYRDAFIIGVGQAIAAMPGLSRSGTTIATGLLLGNKKESMAQFSFLMVLAPILGEMFLNILDGEVAFASIGVVPMLAGFISAFVVGCLACKFMIGIVKRGKLIWFAVYCAVAGVVSIVSNFI